MRRGDGKCDYKLIKNDSISKNYTSDLVDIDDDDLESVPLMESQNFYQNKNQVTVNNYQNQANTKIDSPISGSQQADNQSNVGTATPTAASRKSYIFNDSDEDLITNNSNSAQSSTENLPTDDFTVRRRSKSTFNFCGCLSRCCGCVMKICKSNNAQPRTLRLGAMNTPPHKQYPRNGVQNRKYNFFTFIPIVLFNQFKFFLNLYFLIMALSQFIPEIRVGYLSTYWGPLGFVLGVTMIREAIDDFRRYMRDREVNSKIYEKVTSYGRKTTKSSRIEVGDLIVVHKDERVPADMVLLRTTEKPGACFIRTDQLDGETDWKLRIATPVTQNLADELAMFALDITVYAEKPMKDIHNFVGTIKHVNENGAVHEDALNVENTLWANTVVASGSAVGMVIYTGRETRSAMNASKAHSKGFSGPWFRYLFRFILLFSYIIPLSLRVNLDMAKLVYAVFISKDKDINGTVVRSSTIPEELGRISYLLSDKTGTLTQNKMIFKKLHLGSVAFTTESYEDMKTHLLNAYGKTDITETSTFRQSIMNKVQQAVEAIAICHNVTPVYENENETSNAEDTEADLQQKQEVSYQASSPDEVALVSWADCVGVKLIQRDLHGMQLKSPTGDVVAFKILHLFPFTSENKRMGIIVQREDTKEIILYVKGADSVLIEKVQYNDWLEEECANLAREGLRTLVVAKKVLTEKQYADFDKEYSLAKLSLQDRAGRTAAVISVLENNLQVLCVTGVEDSLQVDVPVTLELLKNAGVKIWMLTGDKLETAICISKSSGLIGRNQSLYVFNSVLNRAEARNQLNNLSRKRDHALIITGQSLKICLEEYEEEFADLASNCPAVVCCRCSPEQKAQIVALIKKYHRPARVAAVGDGGNDVSMIQAADAGIGIVGKEGRQASLAADFSITQFSHLSRLMLVHGRYCYKRSCALSQFVMHRGLIISTMQAIFSCVFYFASVSLYQGMLMVMYSTIYTNLPVFSLVMDKDVKPANLLIFPELYKELSKGRSMSYKTFCLWFIASVYQGAVIMYLALALFDADFIHIVSITFTALIFNELIMVALTIHTWHWVMLIAEIVSLGIYAISLFVMKGYFDVNFVQSSSFWWKTAIITAVACMPLYLAKYLRRRMAPPTYAKLS